ncbi:MAG: zf-HC2 domain-containing protein [Deltaproteobacteria bacterium]
MLSCKDVTKLISESMDASLPIGRRIGVRFHLIICKWCARYERQFVLIRDTARRLATMVEMPGDSPGETLSAEARERIAKSMKNP